jgi:hypothetical protein
MMPIFKLLGHKGICTHKTDPTIAQFLQEYEPRGVSVRNIRQLEGQLNLLGASVHIACSAELLDRGARYPAFDPKGYCAS